MAVIIYLITIKNTCSVFSIFMFVRKEVAKMRLLSSSCLSVCPSVQLSACNKRRTMQRIFTKFSIWLLNIGQELRTLHVNKLTHMRFCAHKSLSGESPGSFLSWLIWLPWLPWSVSLPVECCGEYHASCGTTWGILHDDVNTQQNTRPCKGHWPQTAVRSLALFAKVHFQIVRNAPVHGPYAGRVHFL
jgi:hypothetical protein